MTAVVLTLFPGAHQVFRLRRDTGGLDGDWTTKEVVLGITSLPTDLAGPAHLGLGYSAGRAGLTRS
ncbi:hypothetical protein [Streptomyces sp. 900105245]